MYTCRYCQNKLSTMFVDLGFAPLSNDYIEKQSENKGQLALPLKAAFCEYCKLVQTLDFEMPDQIFNSNYKYFSSYSKSWLQHCKNYVDMIVKRLSLRSDSVVIEIASNDGYLLQYFKDYGISPVGIEPSERVAKAAMQNGIDTIIAFWDSKFADKLEKKADLIIANNVLAHVPDIGDFVYGMKLGLKEKGIVTIEFPHLLNLIRYNQFDTIYHEHYSYLSILAVMNIFKDKGLKIFDIEKLDTHGGSVRVYAAHEENQDVNIRYSVKEALLEEEEAGLAECSLYNEFYQKTKDIKLTILEKLISLKKSGKTIVGYGAAAKGNTLFNYCGIDRTFIYYVADANPHKQNCLLPGSLIPVVSPDEIKKTKPDIIIIIPWNIKDEIKSTLSYSKEWGAKFLVLIPQIEEL